MRKTAPASLDTLPRLLAAKSTFTPNKEITLQGHDEWKDNLHEVSDAGHPDGILSPRGAAHAEQEIFVMDMDCVGFDGSLPHDNLEPDLSCRLLCTSLQSAAQSPVPSHKEDVLFPGPFAEEAFPTFQWHSS